MIEFNAKDSFNIKGRGTVYTGISLINEPYLSREIKITLGDKVITGIVRGVETFGGQSGMGRRVGLLIREEELRDNTR